MSFALSPTMSVVSPVAVNPMMAPMVTNPVLSPTIGPMMSPMANKMMHPRHLVRDVTMKQNQMPFVPTVDFTYSRPTIAMVENLNTDPDVHKKVTKYFYYKVLDKWIYDDMLKILSYFKVDAKKNVSYISSLDDFKEDSVLKFSQEQVDAVVDFIEDHLLTKKMVNSILHKFVGESNVNWYDLPHQEGVVREIISKKLRKNIKSVIAKKSFKKSN